MRPHIQTNEYDHYKVVCDFDGTISRVDVTDGLLEAFAPLCWHEIEAQWKCGWISSKECMLRQVELIDADLSSIDHLLSKIDIDPEFPDFVAECKNSGINVQIVSDGIGYAIKKILARYNLESLSVLANQLIVGKSNRFSLVSPYTSPDCNQGTCKCIPANNIDGRILIVIGDGASDYCVAEKADIVFAKGELIAHCRRFRIPHIPFSSFADIRIQFRQLAELNYISQPHSFNEHMEIIANV